MVGAYFEEVKPSTYGGTEAAADTIVRCVYFPSASTPASVEQKIRAKFKDIARPRVDLDIVVLASGAEDYGRISTFFGVTSLPAVVVSKHWTENLEAIVDSGKEPISARIQGPDQFRHVDTLVQNLEGLTLAFEHSSDEAIKSALRRRTLQGLVKKARKSAGFAAVVLRALSVTITVGPSGAPEFKFGFDGKGAVAN
jgi:hypothetical protein